MCSSDLPDVPTRRSSPVSRDNSRSPTLLPRLPAAVSVGASPQGDITDSGAGNGTSLLTPQRMVSSPTISPNIPSSAQPWLLVEKQRYRTRHYNGSPSIGVRHCLNMPAFDHNASAFFYVDPPCAIFSLQHMGKLQPSRLPHHM